MQEADGNALIQLVPRADIDRVVLRFGGAEHRPIVSLTLGVVLSSVGLVGLLFLFTGIPARVKLGMIAFGAVGGSVLFDTAKKRYFFEVHGKKGMRRLVFSRKATLSEIRTFCAKIQAEFPLPLIEDAALPNTMQRP